MTQKELKELDWSVLKNLGLVIRVLGIRICFGTVFNDGFDFKVYNQFDSFRTIEHLLPYKYAFFNCLEKTLFMLFFEKK